MTITRNRLTSNREIRVWVSEIRFSNGKKSSSIHNMKNKCLFVMSGFSWGFMYLCTYIQKYAHLDFSFQMRNTAFRLLWSKVKRSKIGLFSGPFLLTGRVLISLFTNSPKIYLSVHRLCHLLLQNIFLCRRKKVATEVKEHG